MCHWLNDQRVFVMHADKAHWCDGQAIHIEQLGRAGLMRTLLLPACECFTWFGSLMWCSMVKNSSSTVKQIVHLLNRQKLLCYFCNFCHASTSLSTVNPSTPVRTRTKNKLINSWASSFVYKHCQFLGHTFKHQSTCCLLISLSLWKAL